MTGKEDIESYSNQDDSVSCNNWLPQTYKKKRWILLSQVRRSLNEKDGCYIWSWKPKKKKKQQIVSQSRYITLIWNYFKRNHINIYLCLFSHLSYLYLLKNTQYFLHKISIYRLKMLRICLERYNYHNATMIPHLEFKTSLLKLILIGCLYSW